MERSWIVQSTDNIMISYNKEGQPINANIN
jgi:hypothetical protein